MKRALLPRQFIVSTRRRSTATGIDGDGYLHWNHEASASTLEKAKALISTWPQTKMTWNKLHPELNAENNWTFVGTRAELQTKYNQEEVNSTITEYWGVVIEAQLLLV